MPLYLFPLTVLSLFLKKLSLQNHIPKLVDISLGNVFLKRLTVVLLIPKWVDSSLLRSKGSV